MDIGRIFRTSILSSKPDLHKNRKFFKPRLLLKVLRTEGNVGSIFQLRECPVLE